MKEWGWVEAWLLPALWDLKENVYTQKHLHDNVSRTASTAKAQLSESETSVLATHRPCHLNQVAYLPGKMISSLPSYLPKVHYHQHPKYTKLPLFDLHLSFSLLIVIKFAINKKQ